MPQREKRQPEILVHEDSALHLKRRRGISRRSRLEAGLTEAL
jgi:hypothetical protein